MRNLAAEDHGMQYTGGRDVVDELAAAAQEAEVLQSLDRTADQ